MTRNLLRKFGLNTIQGRLTSIAFFFILVTAVVIGVAGFRLTLNFESRRFHEHFSLLATYLSRNVEVGVLLGNEETLALLSDNMLQVSDVKVVEIVDSTGRTILKRSSFISPDELATVSAPVVSSPLDQGGVPMFDSGGQQKLGTVYLSYSLDGLNRLKKIVAQNFTLVSLALAIVPFILYWLLSRAINAPLQGLLDVAGRVSRGEMEVRASRSSLREIDTLSGALNDMLDALSSQRRELQEANAMITRQEVLAEVGRFSMTVAHEIKNPLAIIKGSLGIFRKEGPGNADIQERMMTFVDEEILRIDKLIEDFLLFARPGPPVFAKIGVQELVDNLLNRATLINESIQIVGATDIFSDTFQVECDQMLLERALLNVVRNAMEAATEPENVQLSITCAGHVLSFKVEDDGAGLNEEDVDKVFEPFFSSKSKGTGLGLAIASSALNAHGGKITAANRAQGGAVFTISIPLLSSASLAAGGSEDSTSVQCRLEDT